MDFFSNLQTPEHRLILEAATKFAHQHIAPNASRWEEEGEFPRDLYLDAGGAGLLGVGFPLEVGGAGGGAMDQVMVIQGLMRGGSTGVCVGLGSLGIALPCIVQSHNDALIDRVVRPTLAGSTISALAITEPGTGSDVASVSTRARLEGEFYHVTGSKLFITSGVRADFITALVRTGDDPHGGLSFLLIEGNQPGVHISPPLKKTGWHASDTAEITFDEVKVPRSNLIGAPGDGFVTLMKNFQMERLALAAYGCATAQICLEEASRYARERSAFGRPLAGFQVTRHKLAEMATATLGAQALVYQVANRMDAGHMVVNEVSMAKNLAAQVAVKVSYEAVQIHGGMGYMRETLVERLSRDARLLPIGGGTHEIMNEIISKGLGL